MASKASWFQPRGSTCKVSKSADSTASACARPSPPALGGLAAVTHLRVLHAADLGYARRRGSLQHGRRRRDARHLEAEQGVARELDAVHDAQVQAARSVE